MVRQTKEPHVAKNVDNAIRENVQHRAAVSDDSGSMKKPSLKDQFEMDCCLNPKQVERSLNTAAATSALPKHETRVRRVDSREARMSRLRTRDRYV